MNRVPLFCPCVNHLPGGKPLVIFNLLEGWISLPKLIPEPSNLLFNLCSSSDPGGPDLVSIIQGLRPSHSVAGLVHTVSHGPTA